jgi:ribokinase
VRQLTARFDDFWNSLNQIDILSINRREAQTFMPRLLQSFGEGGAALSVKSGEPIPALAKRGLRNGGYEMSLLKFLGSLVELGVGAVVLTDGANGSFIAIGHDLYYREAQTVTAAATTGAGDAFSATFACYFADTGDVSRSLAAAVLNAANVVRYVDTQTGLLTRQAMEKELERATDHPLYTWSI